jgi:hypothetical protein
MPDIGSQFSSHRKNVFTGSANQKWVMDLRTATENGGAVFPGVLVGGCVDALRMPISTEKNLPKITRTSV